MANIRPAATKYSKRAALGIRYTQPGLQLRLVLQDQSVRMLGRPHSSPFQFKKQPGDVDNAKRQR